MTETKDQKTRGAKASSSTKKAPASNIRTAAKKTTRKTATAPQKTSTAVTTSRTPKAPAKKAASKTTGKTTKTKPAATQKTATKKPAATKKTATKKPATSKTSSATAKKPAATRSKTAGKQTASSGTATKAKATPKKAASKKAPATGKTTARKAAPKKTAPKKVGKQAASEGGKGVEGASVSYSVVQEPPEHLTLRAENNRVVAFHYRLCEVRQDGSFSPWIEESFGRQPLFYLHGYGNVISGLEQALTGKKAGDAISITLPPEQAYGPRTSTELVRLPIKQLHQAPKSLVPGSIVSVKTNKGIRNALVVKVGKFNVDLDTNHPYAGRTLHYQIEVLGVRPATANETAHRRVLGRNG